MKAEPSFPKECLIDTSVFIAATFENHQKASEVLIHEPSIYILEFMRIEAINVLKSKRVELESLQEILDKLYQKPFNRIPILPVDLETAFRIATDFNVSVYDALYHAVAMKLFLTFLTLDKTYYEKTSSLGWVELLTE